MLVTVLSYDADRRRGLELGADDHVGLRVIKCRVEQVLLDTAEAMLAPALEDIARRLARRSGVA